MRDNFMSACALAAALMPCGLATPALAGSPYDASQDEAPVVQMRSRPIARRQIGHFTCSYNERLTRLERKNCGGQRF